jgi:hypothetical protein
VESRNHQQEVMMKRATWIQSDPSVSQWLVISCSYPVKTKDTQEGSKMRRFQALFGVGMAEIAFHSAFLTATTWSPCSSSRPSFQQLCSEQTAAQELIYTDQQNDLESGAKFEEELLGPNLSSLTPTTANQQLNVVCWPQPIVKFEAEIVHLDRVSRIDTQPITCWSMLLEQQRWAAAKTNNTNTDTVSTTTDRLFYVVEQARTARCDFVLSLLRQGYAWDGDPTVHADQHNSLHILDDALQELLGDQRTLCGMYEELVMMQAAVIPNQESARQWIHPDLPFQDTLPLYVVFVALQNVTEDMGPTSYLMGTHQTMETATGSMGPLKQSGLVVSSQAHHIPLYKLDYGNHDADDANESKTSDSLHSSRPSLWGASLESMATEIITVNDVANIVVQSTTRDDTLEVFCHHILTAIKPARDATSVEKSGIPETTHTGQSDQEENGLLSALHSHLSLQQPTNDTELESGNAFFPI